MTNSEQIIKDLFSSNRKQIIKSLTREKILELNNYLGTKFDFKSEEYGCELDGAIFSLKYLFYIPELSICEIKVLDCPVAYPEKIL